MARSNAALTCWLDTNAVVYLLHGHSLQESAVREAIGGRNVFVPVFVRMEYLRGVILNLAELYGVLRESVTVPDAFVEWSQKVRQERKLKVVLLTVSQWLATAEARPGKEETLRRLGDWLFRAIADFDETFGPPPVDPLGCELGRLTVARPDFDEDVLFEFITRFRAIQRGVPACQLCSFRHGQRRRLRRGGIDLTGPEARRRFPLNAAYLMQADQLNEAAAHRGRSPACRWCARVGDTLIALQLPQSAVLVTAGRTFVALGELLGRPIHLLPSLADLKRQWSSR